ncbi:ABC transporter ATP-binding protein [Bacillus sp. IT-79MI2]|uniref:ABC transporter ATP-binding protein n=1 Tax=Bacillus sp. IT-79MI2 TaxID=3026438 RepID=UPI0039E1F7A0
MKIRALKKVAKLLWKNNKISLILSIIIHIIEALLPLATLWVTKELVNEISNIIENHHNNYLNVVYLLLGQFAITVLSAMMTSLDSLIFKKMELNLNYYVEKNLLLKMKKIHFEFFEDPTFYNKVTRVAGTGNISSQLLSPVKSVFLIASNIISVCTLLSFLIHIHWTLALLSIICSGPFLYFNAMFGKQQFQLARTQTLNMRKANYIKALLYAKQSAKEVKLFNLGDYLIKKWEKYFLENNTKLLKLVTKQEWIKVGLIGIKALLYGISSIIVFRMVKFKELKIGDFVVTIQTIQDIQAKTNIIATEFARIYSETLYVIEYFELCELLDSTVYGKNECKTTHFNLGKVKEIKLNNVIFSYPHSNKNALNNISLQIKAGEHIAVVGENGSGKTTFVQCLLGLYKLKEGNITINGYDIRDLNPEEFNGKFSVIFQDFMKYSFSVRENIAFGDIENMDNNERLNFAAQKSGVQLFMNRFKHGFNTHLGKIFEQGEDLSGGQWQKIAIARALFRNSEVIILDEPTSSLDPKSELEIYRQFEEISKDKIAIFISHRLASTKMADKIIVMDKGEIKEIGTHKELMDLEGKYYDMYQGQYQMYVRESIEVSRV